MDAVEPGVRRIAPDERVRGPATGAMEREEAVATETLWAGFVRQGPGLESDWHHHGEYESVIFIVSGTLRMEFGPEGSQAVDGKPGDFLHIAKGAIHRETTPEGEAAVVVVRTGTGETVVNVDGPEPPGQG